MRDAPEVAARRFVSERDRTEPLAVKLAVGRQDRCPEARDQLGEGRLPRLDDSPRQLVCIDHGGPPLDEELGHSALAGRDTAGQTDHVRRHR